MNRGRLTVAVRALALTALCLVVYGAGLTTQGLVNWQESTRALVAREMQRSGDYLAPTMRGELYIAKPPMIYWAQIALARLMGDEVGEWHLRAVVALAGTLGVLATYFVARRMFREGSDPHAPITPTNAPTPPTHPTPLTPPTAERAAWWSALGLSVAVLYVRSSRMGELDILLVPFTVVAIGAFHAAWSHAERVGRTHLGAVLLCAASGVGAAMVKGPPGVACLAAVMLAAPALRAARDHDGTRRTRRIGAAVGAGAAILGAVLIRPVSAGEAPGIALLAIMGGCLGWAIGIVCSRSALLDWFRTLARTHPVGVLGACGIALWLWGWRLKQVFGAAVIAELASREVGENLNLLMPEAASHNLGFMLYGPAPIAIATIGALVVIAREQVRLSRAQCVLVAWLVGGLIIYSAAGKGVARYLTPLWPACAMLGGWFIARMLERTLAGTARRRLTAALGLVVVVAAGAQAWWYGLGRSAHDDARSVRSLARELWARGIPSVATWRFEDPALELYLDRAVPRFGDERASDAGGDERPAIAGYIGANGPVALLVREPTDAVVRKYGSTIDDLKNAGLIVRELPVEAAYERPPDRTRVMVFVVSDEDHGFPAWARPVP